MVVIISPTAAIMANVSSNSIHNHTKLKRTLQLYIKHESLFRGRCRAFLISPSEDGRCSASVPEHEAELWRLLHGEGFIVHREFYAFSSELNDEDFTVEVKYTNLGRPSLFIQGSAVGYCDYLWE